MSEGERDPSQEAIDFGVDITLLEANLRLTPAERIRELVAMNRFREDMQSRTLSPEMRRRLEDAELRELAGRHSLEYVP